MEKSGLWQTALEAIEVGEHRSRKITLTSSFGKELTAKIIFKPMTIKGTKYLLCTFDDLSEVKQVENEREEMIRTLTY